MTIFAIELIVAVYLSIGAFLAVYGAVTESLSEFSFLSKLGILLAVVFLWPASYARRQREEDRSLIGRSKFRK